MAPKKVVKCRRKEEATTEQTANACNAAPLVNNNGAGAAAAAAAAEGHLSNCGADAEATLNARIGRAFFGLDEEAFHLLDGAIGGEDGDADAPVSDSRSEHASIGAGFADEYADVLCGFGNDTEGGGMGAPSPSAGFGMRDEGAPTSTMWSGLGVENGGMGLREVSDRARDTGYESFLEEVEMIKEIFAENGEVEEIRSKNGAITDSSAAQAVPAPSANSGRVIAIRAQVMPLRLLEAFNRRVVETGGGKYKGSGASARQASKGLHVIATYVEGYPDRPPLVSVEPWHNLLPTNGIMALNKKIVEIIQNSIGAPLLMPTLMMIAQECEELIERFEEGDIKEIAAAVRGVGIKTRLSSEAMHPDRYLGSNIADIIAGLPRNIAVQCIENIMRTDLALSFEKMQRYLFDKNVKPFLKMKNLRNQSHILAQAEAVPSFHGTRMDTVGYIVRDGLLVPGGDSGIAVRCGSRFGNGIYSSPDANFASLYAERHGKHYKLLLCATLLGKADVSEDYDELDPRFDSRVADGGRQFVVFHKAQILPCYVLHIKIFDPVTMQQVFPELRNTLRAEMRDVTADADAGFFGKAEIEKRKREVLTRLALKSLPFGFGPKGAHFIVEDMADVSDDDEFLDMLRNGDGDTVARIGTNHADEMFQHETVITNRYGTSHKNPGT